MSMRQAGRAGRCDVLDVCDGEAKDESPDHAEDELQVAVDDVLEGRVSGRCTGELVEEAKNLLDRCW